ncbi:MAG: hypothetical protein EPN26_02205 [Rhodospirillales bacterium]|nr:MAG: hypothetical protein EPN26_02205 [Rhodospirillales bacterium]
MAKEPEKKVETAAPPPRKEPVKGAGAPVVLRDRYQIYPATPLFDFDLPSATAFACADKRDPTRYLLAYVCKPELPPRVNVMRVLKGQQFSGIMPLLDWGVLEWPPAGRQCLMVIYQRPLGGRVMPSLDSEIAPLEEHELVKKIMPQMTLALKELTEKGIPHRAIRPTNLYWMDEHCEQMVLGDCVTAPPAYDQPVMFESIEVGMCLPAARGSGSYADDLYALGVSMLMLKLGRNPLKSLDTEPLLRGKILKGSYSLLVGDERLPLSMIELLRGLLCDDPHERWSVNDLELWANGRRLSPLQPKQEKRAVRGFAFAGAEYNTCRELAFAMSMNWDKALAPMMDGSLELWLRRGIENKELADAASAAFKAAKQAPASDLKQAEDLLVTRMLLLLDPMAPIRYKSLSALPLGFGPALAVIMATKSDPKLFADCLLREVPHIWFETRPEYDPSNSQIDSMFKDLKAFMQQTSLGYGLERVLYDLNEALPCQSPLVADSFVVDIDELLPALEQTAKRIDPRTLPMDRHLAAFIACRFDFNVERQITALNDKRSEQQIIGVLSLLGTVQWKLGPESLPGLASWMGAHLGPVVGGYHSRVKRREMEKELPKLVRSGNLPELFAYAENNDEKRRDEEGFLLGRAEYAAASQEANDIETGTARRNEQAVRLGHQAAGVISMMLALCVLSILLLIRFL